MILEAPWSEKNARIVKEHGLKMRSRSVPDTDVPIRMEPGLAQPLSTLPKIALAPGVALNLVWSKGALLAALEMDPGATYPRQHLTEELIAVVREGSAICTLDGQTLELTLDSILYLTPGMSRSLKAGPNGLKALEVFSPVRIDLLAMAGLTLPATAKVSFLDQGVQPSLRAGEVYRLGEVQLTPVTDPDPSLTYKRSGANARLIWGSNVMLSFVRMDPDSYFPVHNHPEHQLMTVLRGALTQTVVDSSMSMTDEERSTLLMPGGMVHSARMSEFGGDALDIFWPVRPDYIERAQKQNALYHQVIAPGTKPAREGTLPKVIEASHAWLYPEGDFLYASDVQPDGSLANERKFAKLHLTDAVLSAPDPVKRGDARAGGMAVDTDGRVYVATLMGVQIFDKTGTFVGNIWCPEPPVNVAFGGENDDILYIVGEKEAWSIQTKVKGLRLPAGPG